MSEFNKVTREEYLAFINGYQNKLEFDCTGICEPPLESYNDFSGGKIWPYSMVAKASRNWLGPNGEIDSSNPGKFWSYYIKKSHSQRLDSNEPL